MQLELTKKQKEFIDATENEVLFGGAAGGGKSRGQLADMLLYALKYPRSRQLCLRRTFPDLERSLILQHLSFYPAEKYRYNSTSHRGVFFNGSVIEFGYCDSEQDVYRYQGAEYDVIRFDELTHFTQQMYIYLLSRLRGANSYPKQVKSTTNPGGIGHSWVKKRFIDPAPPNHVINTANGTRRFLPSLLQDNPFLEKLDPMYKQRLENLAEKDKRALLYGDWNLQDGQYFTEWDERIHVLPPFEIPAWWRRYVTLDYGLDMFACYFIAVDGFGRAYVYKEIYTGQDNAENGGKSVLPTEAARLILAEGEHPETCIAPPDLWNRQKDTGKSIADKFAEAGVYLQRASNRRVQGWLDLKEWLKPGTGENGEPTAGLRVFATCRNLIRTLPALGHCPKNPNDVATTPHELTHAADAIRYFTAGRPQPAQLPFDESMQTYESNLTSFLEFGNG